MEGEVVVVVLVVEECRMHWPKGRRVWSDARGLSIMLCDI